MIRLKTPYMGEREAEAVCDVLKTGCLSQGKLVERFEERLCEYLNISRAIAVSSGTAALHLSLIALGLGSGDEVIVPDFTFPASANVIELVGSRPVFVDIDSNTLNIDIDLIRHAITDKTRAVMPVHLFGRPADMKGILEIAEKNNLFVIEDAACALGSGYYGIKCGTMGNTGCFSFHPRKIITTGEGGMIAANDNNLADRLKALRSHGMKTDFNKKTDFVLPGLNYRMTEIQAALGIEQMKKIKNITDSNRNMAYRYSSLLKDKTWVKRLPLSANGQHKHKIDPVTQSYVIVLDSGYRDKVIRGLRKEGIEAAIGTYALHMTEYYKKKYSLRDEDFPVSKYVYENSLTLPLHHEMNEEDVQYIVEKTEKIIFTHENNKK